MSSVSIRQATVADAEALCELGKATFAESFACSNTAEDMQKYLREQFTLEKVRAELTNPDSMFFFAAIADTLVGYLKVNVGAAQTEIKAANCLEVQRIYVLQAHQCHRVGQALYDKALEIAKARGVDYIWLGVWEKNPRAIAFYHRNGFVEFDRHVFVLGDDHQIGVMMKCKL